jgi:CheY-like chemotaxis protein/class 3 adenylate cyclase
LTLDDKEDDSSTYRYQQDKIVNDNNSLNLTNYSNNDNDNDEVTFTKYSYSYCICIIRIVDFTQKINKLKNPEEIRRYYSIFYNTMASIIKQHGGKVIKNVEDGLLFYFPRTVNFSKMSSFRDVLDCGLSMTDANFTLNSKLDENRLPIISYAISANYGKLEIATSSNSYGVDLFGPTVNICSKINHLAMPNQMVIYKDLYDVIEKTPFFKDYIFKRISESEVHNKDYKHQYPVYSINRIENKRQHISIDYEKMHEHLENNRNIKNQPNSSFNILLIDDDKDILFTFESIVRNEGYNVTSYSDSNIALEHLSNLDPYYYDLVILDIRMPGFNGFQLYKQIKVLNSDTKVLFLSALDVAEEIMIVCPGTNASDIIRKPIKPDDLISKIKSTLRS